MNSRIAEALSQLVQSRVVARREVFGRPQKRQPPVTDETRYLASLARLERSLGPIDAAKVARFLIDGRAFNSIAPVAGYPIPPERCPACHDSVGWCDQCHSVNKVLYWFLRWRGTSATDNAPERLRD